LTVAFALTVFDYASRGMRRDTGRSHKEHRNLVAGSNQAPIHQLLIRQQPKQAETYDDAQTKVTCPPDYDTGRD
jgi:hypothetical protein